MLIRTVLRTPYSSVVCCLHGIGYTFPLKDCLQSMGAVRREGVMVAERIEQGSGEELAGWMHPTGEWGMRGTPSRKGLTIEDVDQGSYGPIYDTSRNATMRKRGAAARPDAPRVGHRWEPKAESWSASVAMLYEEATLRQWSSATDIPWDQLTQLPDDLELAMCQLCTFLTQVEFIAADLPGRWLQYISP